MKTFSFIIATLLIVPFSFASEEVILDFSPPRDEQQLPRAMHSQMDERPSITVGQSDADIVGSDNRALQAAVDYIAALGGGTVHIGAGEYMMYDSLHLRSNVTVHGQREKTILRKADGVKSPLAIDGDYGEEQFTVVNPEGFQVGYGVVIIDNDGGGFHSTVARITGKRDNTFSIDRPLNDDCMVHNDAYAATVYPVVSGYHLENARVEGLTIEGNKENNVMLNGCRGAGIFLFRGFGTVLQDCIVRNYNGDGISFQQSNDVTVINCISEGNTQLGIHPGSGSQRPTIQNCIARNNGTDGLFLCWRVRHGLFENNILEGNGRFGISIGHKDTDNLLRNNQVRSNDSNGVFFRNETLGMAGHRNRLENNIIENNGKEPGTAGIRFRGETNDVELVNNIIRDTRANDKKQTIGILIEEKVGPLKLINNKIEAEKEIEDKREK